MRLQQHVSDISGMLVASVLATASDAMVYAILILFVVSADVFTVGVAATVGAVVGGAIHYSLCRFWVFRRFEAPLPSSLALYLAMSWLAAAGHGMLTQWLSGYSDVVIGWLVSKSVFWILWTYPLSRFVVFYERSSSVDDS